MSLAVAPVRMTSDAAHSPTTASSRIGSKGSASPIGRAGAAAGTSSTSRIGVLTEGGVISERVRFPGHELDLLPVPLRHDRPRDRRRGGRAPAAVLDRHRDDDRPRPVVDEAHVPRLVVGPARALRGARLAEDRVALLRPALPDVGRCAVDGGRVQAVEDGLARDRIELDALRRPRLDALQGASTGILDRLALGPRTVRAVGDAARAVLLLATSGLPAVQAVAPGAVRDRAAELSGR